MSIIIIFLVVMFCLCYGWGLMVKYTLKNVSCTRAFSQPTFFAGDEGELIEVVRNNKPFILPWMRVESRISPYIRLGRQDNLHVSGEMYYCSLFTVMPHQQIRRRHRVKFLHRGYYDLGSVSITAGDMLGLSKAYKIQELSVPVLVYPQLMSTEDLPVPMSRTLGEIVRRQQLLQDPFLVRGIRAYQPGDPVRDIHWPATARTGEVHIRVHDYTAKTRLLVVLNMQSEELQWRDHLAEQDIAVAEYGISLAATLCVESLRAGLAAGFATNMPMAGSKESTVMLPADGTSREEDILANLARLNIVRTQHFPTLLESLTAYSGLDILVLSRYDSDSVREGIRLLEAAGNQVSLHLLEGGGKG